MNVYWTSAALDDLDAIYAFIARESKVYAKQTVRSILRRSRQFGEFPLSGRRIAEFDVNQLREVIQGPYRIIYHIKPSQIDVIAVVHSARNELN